MYIDTVSPLTISENNENYPHAYDAIPNDTNDDNNINCDDDDNDNDIIEDYADGDEYDDSKLYENGDSSIKLKEFPDYFTFESISHNGLKI